jgi:hypothetical protein
MQITYDKFIEIVKTPSLHAAGVHAISRAHKIVVQQYCDKLTMRSACSGECDTCILQVKGVVDWINGLTDTPKEPYGLYTRMMKNAFARQVEVMNNRAPAEPEKNILGEATGRDAFDMFLETLA